MLSNRAEQTLQFQAIPRSIRTSVTLVQINLDSSTSVRFLVIVRMSILQRIHQQCDIQYIKIQEALPNERSVYKATFFGVIFLSFGD